MITFTFSMGREIVESCVVIATPTQWAAMPESRDRAWNVHRDPGGLMVANRLRFPTSVLGDRDPGLAAGPVRAEGMGLPDGPAR